MILYNEISVLEKLDAEPLEILRRAPRNTIWEALYYQYSRSIRMIGDYGKIVQN